MTRFQILYWADVPSLVRVLADDGDTRVAPRDRGRISRVAEPA